MRLSLRRPPKPYYEFADDPRALYESAANWNDLRGYIVYHVGRDKLNIKTAAIRNSMEPEPDEPAGKFLVRQRLAILAAFSEVFSQRAYESTPWQANVAEPPKSITEAKRRKFLEMAAPKPTEATKPALKVPKVNFDPESAVLADVAWVYAHLGEEPSNRKAPDPGKLGLWSWAYTNPAEFYRTMIPKLLAHEEQLRKEAAEKLAKAEAKQAELEKAKTEEERAQAAILDADLRAARERIRAARKILSELVD